MSVSAGRLTSIRMRGVRQNNLTNLDVDIPLGKLIVVTGVSGSGKSSLAFDCLYSEGQRRYVETFSSYTRQFLDRMARPEVDSIEGIPAAVAIDQSGAIKTSRSTVGTMTGLNDYLKVLYARRATAVCPHCENEVRPESTAAVVDFVRALPRDASPVYFVAELSLGGFESADIVASSLRGQGYRRFLRGGEPVKIDDLRPGDLEPGTLAVVVDRFVGARASEARLADSADQTFRLGRGTLIVQGREGRLRVFHDGVRCGSCGLDFPRPTPGLFSFNTPYGACPRCKGFGKTIEVDLDRVIPDPRLSIAAGAIRPWTTPSRRKLFLACKRFCEAEGIPVDVPFGELPRSARTRIIEGGGRFPGVRGFFRRLEQKKFKMHVRVLLSRYRGYFSCEDCGGHRLRREAFYFRVAGRTLADLWAEPVKDLLGFFEQLIGDGLDRASALIVDEVVSRLRYLESVGLGYLTLGRQSKTLSGGEVERVNLTTALGASLVETLFVLDEPSIGLHARDNARLLQILRAIRDRGNTVVVVEHDPEILRAADWVIDLGPGAGAEGGRLVAAGTIGEVSVVAGSQTAAFLRGERSMPQRSSIRRPESGYRIRVRRARAHNLRDLDVRIPLGCLVSVTGVSGSGKSTLVEDVIYRASRRGRGEAVEGEIEADGVDGLDLVDDVVLVDQSPLGRTSRGNPATYVKVYNVIRDRFAATGEARRARLSAGDFSFNVEGGRCPECAGAGAIDVEMQFLSDVSLPCEACGGKRFQEHVLAVRHGGLDIHQTLELTLREAIAHFEGDPEIVEPLTFLDGLGLGYLALGQPLNTLSGGEAQRLKLASRVLSTRRSRLLFLLDEPTTGLHLADVARLIEVLDGLVAMGHSVLVIEHHLDVIRAADWVIDLGPEGGDGGGRLVAEGPPREVASCRDSITGQWLARASSPSGAGSREERRAVAARLSETGAIRVVGARENNLQNITVSLPRERLVVVTGMSGSGKSSLLYDIVHAEGQRRYLDCLSPYARQFVEELHRPDVDHLEGIAPTVAIEQRTTIGGRKSTVGTVTEIYQFLRLLFTRIGEQHCPECDVPVVPRSLEQIRAGVLRLGRAGGRILAPAIRGKKGYHHTLLGRAARLGIREARIDGKWTPLRRDRELRLDRHRAHDVDLVVGRLSRGEVSTREVRDAVDLGLEFGEGVVVFLDDEGRETVFSRSRSCPSCGRDFPEPDPRNFSFNSRHGACPSCDGYGTSLELDSEKLVGDWRLPLDERGAGPLNVLDADIFPGSARGRFLREAVAAGVDASRPISRLGERQRRWLFEGKRGGFPGLIGVIEGHLERAGEEERERFLASHGTERVCRSCGGSRLRDIWAAVKIGGQGIADLSRLGISDLRERLASLRLSGARQTRVGRPIVGEVLARLTFLEELGLGYLGVDRRVDTLSGGEAQRIRLAAQLGSNLRGVCYILDEPTIGLHATDNDRLLESLRALRDRGNSVLVIEHDEATIEAADHVVDLGPGPGRRGGRVVAEGTFEEILACPESATGRHLRNRDAQTAAIPGREPCGPWIVVQEASRHNLRGIDARFPLGALTVVAGVSGAGKSTLTRELLEVGVRNHLRGVTRPPRGCRGLSGAELVQAVREVDQRPIGRSPRSTPATYVGLWNHIRKIFAATADARVRGFGPARFSFNVKGGRCERCAGQGQIRMEMSFLPEVRIDCDRCRGERFDPETLKVTYRGRTIGEVLAMEIAEAREFFTTYRELARPLTMLEDLGLGYLTLGQASTTLSGGEAQRVKLGVELGKSTAAGKVLYILDEPTTGLHMADVERLTSILRRLADLGHAVVVIEHHLGVLAGADWVIELGPGGGGAGGQLIYQGPPAGLLDPSSSTPTARALRQARRSGGHRQRRA